MRRAGLVIVGRTNTSEFGLAPTTEPAFGGATINPWRKDLSPGGSSGGSAAIVAARGLPMGHATDGGGSIRIPASLCGLFGLKPSRGRISLAPIGETLAGAGAQHCVSISVRDSAALLDATAGGEPGDPYGAPPPRARSSTRRSARRASCAWPSCASRWRRGRSIRCWCGRSNARRSCWRSSAIMSRRRRPSTTRRR